GVFDRFGAAVDQQGLLRECPRRQRIQLLSQLYIFLVGRDAEAGVNELIELWTNGGDDARSAMSDIQNTYAAREIEKAIAIDVFEHDAFGSSRKNWSGMRHAARNRGFPAAH